MRRTLGLTTALIAMAALMVTGPAPTTAAGGCSLKPTQPYTHYRVVMTRGYGTPLEPRVYSVYVPPGLSGQVPLLVSLHGAGGGPPEQESVTGWDAFAASHGFIVAYPYGRPNLWDFYEGSPDVSFMRDLVQDVASVWCIDRSRVYADGHSNGGLMVGRLACDASDVFAAVVPYGGAPPWLAGDPCTPARPIGVGIFHGANDTTANPDYARRSLHGWLELDECPPTSIVTFDRFGSLRRATGCAGGVEVWLRWIRNQGHGWPTGAVGEDTRTRMWTFLTAHTLPAQAPPSSVELSNLPLPKPLRAPLEDLL